MPNDHLRFRQPPEVHEAAQTLRARGVDVGALVGRTILDAAREESGLVQWAEKNGLRARKTQLVDQDGFVVSVATNGAGGAPDESRVVCAFVYISMRRQWIASATRIVNGFERLSMTGPFLPADLPVDRWVSFAEGLLPKEGA